MNPTLPEGHRLHVFAEPIELMEGAAEAMIDSLGGLRRAPRVVLAGGRTPLNLYGALSSPAFQSRLDWERVRFTFSDERGVPPDHEESNYGMVRAALLQPLKIPEDHVVRMRGEDPPEAAAEKAHHALQGWTQQVPLFDLVLLGLGEDGHVASLFPAESWPDFGTRLVAATRHPSGQDRITLTPAALRAADRTFFLVSGARKAEAVRDTLTAAEASPRTPARLAVGKEAVWFLDREAAALLPPQWVE